MEDDFSFQPAASHPGWVSSDPVPSKYWWTRVPALPESVARTPSPPVAAPELVKPSAPASKLSLPAPVPSRPPQPLKTSSPAPGLVKPSEPAAKTIASASSPEAPTAKPAPAQKPSSFQPPDPSAQLTETVPEENAVEDLDAAIRQLADPDTVPAPEKVLSKPSKKLAPFGKNRNLRRFDATETLFQADPTEKITKVVPSKSSTSAVSANFKKASGEPRHDDGSARKMKKESNESPRPLSEVLKSLNAEKGQDQISNVVAKSSSTSSKPKRSDRSSNKKRDIDVDELADRFLTSVLVDEKSRRLDIGGAKILTFDDCRDPWTNRAHGDGG